MSTRVYTTCDECGWRGGPYRTRPQADYAHSRHSCDKARRGRAAYERGMARAAAVDRTPKPCLHERANHQHGTHACYVLDACRCVPCAVANTAYEADRTRRNAYGRGDLIDAEPIRAHTRALRDAGIGLRTISRRSGVSEGVLTKLVYGVSRGDGTHRPPARRVHKDTARRIFAITEQDRADGARVDPVGTTRRMQALIALGWSVSRLAADHGIDRQAMDAALAGAPVKSRTATAVRVIFEAIGDRTPPETNQRERIAASRSRRRAAEHGWFPPAMWDDADLDDPYAEAPDGYGRPLCVTPGCSRGDVAAKGLCWAHYRGAPSRDRLDLDEWAHLVRGGEDVNRAAQRCGVADAGTVETAARRDGRDDILRLLREGRTGEAA